eukprot:278323-Prymnesium_polylepis.1
MQPPSRWKGAATEAGVHPLPARRSATTGRTSFSCRDRCAMCCRSTPKVSGRLSTGCTATHQVRIGLSEESVSNRMALRICWGVVGSGGEWGSPQTHLSCRIGVTYHVGQWSISELADSTFCLAPSGWGYGWRTYLALAVQCIPVIVQPYVQQAFEDLLPYASFSLRISPDELQGLPDRLRAMPRSRICSMRAAGARYFRAVLWQQPEGIAYDMLQLSLCRRAIGVLTRHRPGASLPRWAGCANVTAEQLLD